MSLHDEDLPVLNAVVKSGNPSLIQSARMGNEVLRELESLRQEAVRAMPVPQSSPAESDTLRDSTIDAANGSAVEIPQGLDFASLGNPGRDNQFYEVTDPLLDGLDELDDEATVAIAAEQTVLLKDEEIEMMIDDIVDRHITALRLDIKQLLERARSSP